MRETRNILFISHCLSRTGAPIVLLDMVQACQKAGYSVEVISMEEGELREEYSKIGVAVEIADDFLEDVEKWKWIFTSFDLVVVNTLVCIEAVYVLNTLDIPVLWWIHEHEYWFIYYKSIMIPERDLKSNIHVYGVSPITNMFISKYCGYSAELLPFGIVDRANTDFSLSNKETVRFVIPATISYVKGQDILLDAIRNLPIQIREKCEFDLFGAINEGEKEFYYRIKDESSQIAEIKFEGALDHEEALKMISEADYLIVPSRMEPFSATAVESLMFSTIPIVSDICGICHFLNHEHDSLFFESENVEDLSEIISEAVNIRLNTNDTYLKIRENARKKYEDIFSIEKFYKSVNEIISDILISKL